MCSLRDACALSAHLVPAFLWIDESWVVGTDLSRMTLHDPLNVEARMLDGFALATVFQSPWKEGAVGALKESIMILNDGWVVKGSHAWLRFFEVTGPPIGASLILGNGNSQLMASIIGIIVNREKASILQVYQLEA